MRDISTVRIIRKGTSPLPVSAPIKKVPAIASTSKASLSASEMDKTVKTESHENNSQVVDEQQVNDPEKTDEIVKQELNVNFTVISDENVNTKQTLKVKLDEVELMSSTVRECGKRKLSEMNINFGDFLQTITINPEDIFQRKKEREISICFKTQK